MNKNKEYAFFYKKNVKFNPVYFKIKRGDSGFSRTNLIRRVLKTKPQKFEAISITRPRSSFLP